MSKVKPKNTEAQRRIAGALKHIAQAQIELLEACGLISNIIGLDEDCDAIGAEADRVKALWHSLNGRAAPKGGWKKDSE